MFPMFPSKRIPFTAAGAVGLLVFLTGCLSPRKAVDRTDKAAYGILRETRKETLGRDDPFTVERPAELLRKRLVQLYDLPSAGPASFGTGNLEPPEHWPKGLTLPVRPEQTEDPPTNTAGVLKLTLKQTLEIAAANNSEYQGKKEDVFRVALALDLTRDGFRSTFAGTVSELASTDRSGEETVDGSQTSGSASFTRKLQTGTEIATQLAVDLVKLLSGDTESALGLVADASVTVPLLQGARRHIVREALTQAERNVVYAIWEFEEYKRGFAVRVTQSFLNVLRNLNEVGNAEENYRMLVASTARVRRMADAGRLPEIQVDQSRQDELRAYDRLVRARQVSLGVQDDFKRLLGIPTDVEIELDEAELDKLLDSARDRGMIGTDAQEPAAEQGQVVEAGQNGERRAEGAIRLALEKRLDLSAAIGRVADAQRAVVVAADGLKANVSLVAKGGAGSARSVSSASSGDAKLEFDRGTYSAQLDAELPFEKTKECHALRTSLIDLEKATRDVQGLEDDIKQEIRGRLRELAQLRESMAAQARSVELALRRQRSTDLFLQAGRAEVRDLLEAQEALLSARNALTAAIVSHRLAELGLQRDLGVLRVDEMGRWEEVDWKEAVRNDG